VIVKKTIILLSIWYLFSAQFTSAIKVQDISPSDYVTDYTNTLSGDQILEISTILGNIEKEKGFQVGVVMVDKMEDEFGRADYIEHFTTKLYERLGLGSKEKDEGVLWLISKEDREMRMEVGYGLESLLTDGVTKNIQDNFARPQFKSENYYFGIKTSVEQIQNVLTGEDVSVTTTPGGRVPEVGGGLEDLFAILVVIFVFGVNILTWFFAIIARTKSWWLGGVAGFFLSVPFFYFIFGLDMVSVLSVMVMTGLGFFFDYKISKNYLYWKNKLPISINGYNIDDKNRPAWWAGGSWGPGGGGFGGKGGSGFGGFGGGGMSGGGGSSSSW
jgi:uncharacterized protein